MRTTFILFSIFVLSFGFLLASNNRKAIAQSSPSMQVQDLPKNLNAKEIVITKVSPPDNDITSDNKPLIYVEFKPSAEIDKTKTYLKLNGQEVNYAVYTNSIQYRPTENIASSKIKVDVKLVTKDGYSQEKTWTFNFPTKAQPNPDQPTVVRADKILGLPKPIGLLILAIIIISLLGLILYFFVKLLKTIREERQGNLEAEFTEYYDYKTPINKQNIYEAKPQDANIQPELPTSNNTSPDMNQYLAPQVQETKETNNLISEIKAPSTQQPQPLDSLINQPLLPNVPLTPLEEKPDPFIEEMKRKYSTDAPLVNPTA